MNEDWLIQAETICTDCGGRCCRDAHPPVSGHCHERLLAGGVPQDFFITNGYRHIRSRPDGTCICWEGGKCSIHALKPETCRAGPFTFDVRNGTIELFLKFESICPLVRLLNEIPGAYDQQYSLAVKSITYLVANLPADELEVICSIEEPETEKVAEIPRIIPGNP